MSSLQVRELPEEIYTILNEQAHAEHRSLAQQAVVVLKRGLERSGSSKGDRVSLLREIREYPVIDRGDSYRSPAEMVRGDRDR